MRRVVGGGGTSVCEYQELSFKKKILTDTPPAALTGSGAESHADMNTAHTAHSSEPNSAL